MEDDVVWVHIDGGADETPVRKTINCEQGEVVQVRIANGSAFLVGNASAPPTDDKTANVAHFVAEQADAKATEAIESVNAIVQTVRGKVAIGDSNIQDLSSTMYQNEYGVNIFNDTLSAGDSYAHIDGDEFCIREVTSAGIIGESDVTLAKFGIDETVIGTVDADGNRVRITDSGIDIVNETLSPYVLDGWRFDAGSIGSIHSGVYGAYEAELINSALLFQAPTIGDEQASAKYTCEYLELHGWNLVSGDDYTSKLTEKDFVIKQDAIFNYKKSVTITHESVTVMKDNRFTDDQYTEITAGDIELTGHVKDTNSNNLTPTVLTSTTISAATTSYTFTDDAITADSVIDIYDTIFGFAPTGMTVSAGSATITFPAQSSSHTIKLFVY